MIQGPGGAFQRGFYNKYSLNFRFLTFLHPRDGDPPHPWSPCCPPSHPPGEEGAFRLQGHNSTALCQQHRDETPPHSFLSCHSPCRHSPHCSPEQPLTLCCHVSPRLGHPALMGGTEHTAVFTEMERGLKPFVSSSNPNQRCRLCVMAPRVQAGILKAD